MNILLRRVIERIIKTGNLKITGADGKIYHFGNGEGAPAHIRFNTARAERAVALHPTLALAEAFMDEELDFIEGDILSFLQGKASSPRHELFYLTGTDLQAVRDGSWKLRVAESAAELYDLDRDPGERLNVADTHADVVERLRTRLEAFRAQLASAPGGVTTPH